MLSAHVKFIVVFAVMVLQLVSASANADDMKPIPVEILRGGDDGLTIKFSEALESAFQNSHRFKSSSNKEPATLIVTIPTHAWASEFGNRIQVKVIVNFSSVSSEPMGTTIASCWMDNVSSCADQVVEYAKKITVH